MERICDYCKSSSPQYVCSGCSNTFYCGKDCQSAEYDLHQFQCVGAKHYSKRQRAKIHKVLSEFKRGTLKSGSGKKVTSRDQALAIALSEARRVGEDSSSGLQDD